LANGRFGYRDKSIFLNLKCESLMHFAWAMVIEHLRFKKMLQAQAGAAGRAGIRHGAAKGADYLLGNANERARVAVKLTGAKLTVVKHRPSAAGNASVPCVNVAKIRSAPIKNFR
jgi:hypothetical protein